MTRDSALGVLLALLWSLGSTEQSLVSVSLPAHYTAMEGDLTVAFVLSRPNAFEHNAMIHVEYLPGDAGLPRPSAFRSRPVAGLPVPLGLRTGSVVFMCGSIKHAGPYRAFLTVNGERRAESEILQVSWPAMSITAPSTLEMYSTDVSVSVAFTRSLCNAFTAYGDLGSRKRSSLGFTTTLDLIECSKSVVDADRQDCQAPSGHAHPRVWLSHPVDSLFRRPAFSLTVNCSVWGQSGTFRLFLRTNLTQSAVVARGGAIRVTSSGGYSLASTSAFALPCVAADVRPLAVQRPRCAPDKDKIRVFGQGLNPIGGRNLLPSDWIYLGEASVAEAHDGNLVLLQCDLFLGDYWRFCFHYVSINMHGATETMARLCIPAKDSDSSLAVSSWSWWSSWGACTGSCGARAVQARYRICNVPHTHAKAIICEGRAMEERSCGGACPDDVGVSVPAHDPRLLATIESLRGAAAFEAAFDGHLLFAWSPAFNDETISPCRCGCIFIVGDHRRVELTSGPHCTTPRWKLKVSDNQTMFVNVSVLELSCLEGVVKVHDGDDSLSELVSKVGFFDRHPFAFHSRGAAVVFELEGATPNSTCQVNINLHVQSQDVIFPFSETYDSWFRRTLSQLGHLYHYLPAVAIILLALVVVTVACCLFLMCHFEYQRKRYVACKSGPCSGYSTPTAGARTYIPLEDLETAMSSVEDMQPLISRASRNRLRFKLKLKLAEKEMTQLRAEKEASDCGGLSLPASPFLSSRRFSASSALPPAANAAAAAFVSPRQLRLALASTPRKGRGSAARCPYAVPIPTPTLFFDLQKRHSRSLSEILSVLTFEVKATSRPRSKLHARDNLAFVRCPPGRAQTAALVNKSLVRVNGAASSCSTISSSRGSKSRSASQDTLKPTGSISGLSEQELEYDLYDYHLDNVAANPGSLFAQTYFWSGLDDYAEAEATPTQESVIANVFDADVCIRREVRGRERVVANGEDVLMLRSRTSDLTASVTSAELLFVAAGSSATSATSEDAEPEDAEASTLLLRQCRQKNNILNLTHIDDEISFADDEEQMTRC